MAETIGSMPYVTVSRAWLFERCPRAYRLRYVDRLADAPVDDAAAAGTAIHAGLETAARIALAAGELAPWADVEAEVSEAIGDAYAEGTGPWSGETLDELLAATAAWWADAPLDPGQVLHVEERFTFTWSGHLPSGPRTSVRIGGKADRVDRVGGPGAEPFVVEVIDYKRTAWRKDRAHLALDRQTNVYAGWAKAELGAEQVLITHDYVDPAPRELVTVPADPALIDRHLAGLAEVAVAIERERAWDPHPQPRSCSRCEFRTYCPEGQAAAAQEDR